MPDNDPQHAQIIEIIIIKTFEILPKVCGRDPNAL